MIVSDQPLRFFVWRHTRGSPPSGSARGYVVTASGDVYVISSMVNSEDCAAPRSVTYHSIAGLLKAGHVETTLLGLQRELWRSYRYLTYMSVAGHALDNPYRLKEST